MGTSAITISVALCTYKGEPYLAEQLDSIARQTHPPAELIVSDDGSTDATEELVRSFARQVHFPVRWKRNPVNLGSTRNFEHAIGLCTGSLIALCDQDDLWMPEKLARSAAVLAENPAAAAVFSNASLIDEAGTPLAGDLWQRVGFDQRGQQDFERKGPLYLIRRDTVTGAALVFRSSFRPRLLPFGPAWVHDGWLALLLASLAPLLPIPDKLFAYRLHSRQQIGADLVPWSAHLSTKPDRALAFHRYQVERFTAALAALDALHREHPLLHPEILPELRRKIRFEQGRTGLLEASQSARLLPALRLLPGYMRYEKGVFSLLRDLTHRTADNVPTR